MNKTNDLKLNKINSVFDGDTFRATINAFPPIIGENMPFRIAGIDTPEIRGSSERVKATAREARKLVIQKFENAKKITVDLLKRDKYGRFLVNVRADGEDIAQALMAASLAVPYNGGTRQKW